MEQKKPFPEKPDTMELKEWSLKKTAYDLNLPYSLVKTIIRDMFNTAEDQMQGDANSIEIYDLGNFIIDSRKLKHKERRCKIIIEHINKNILKELEAPTKPNRVINLRKRLEVIERQLVFVKKKLKRYEDKKVKDHTDNWKYAAKTIGRRVAK